MAEASRGAAPPRLCSTVRAAQFSDNRWRRFWCEPSPHEASATARRPSARRRRIAGSGRRAHLRRVGVYQCATSPAGLAPRTLAVGRFNADLVPDVAVAHSSSFEDSLAILLGNGDGTFGEPKLLDGGDIDVLVAADFNGDGFDDLAFDAGGSVAGIMISNGDGTFEPSRPVQGTSEHPAGADRRGPDGTGVIDLVLSSWDGQAFVVPGNDDGTFDEDFSREPPAVPSPSAMSTTTASSTSSAPRQVRHRQPRPWRPDLQAPRSPGCCATTASPPRSSGPAASRSSRRTSPHWPRRRSTRGCRCEVDAVLAGAGTGG